jgi:hypothetical protein
MLNFLSTAALAVVLFFSPGLILCAVLFFVYGC